MENKHVKELLDILAKEGKDENILTALFSSVSAMERQLCNAAAGLESMQRELSTMREERNHPVRTLLEKSTRSLCNRVNGIRARIKAIKDGIINGCKKAVAAFKDKGITALNDLAEFFDVKQSLLDERKSIQSCIKQAKASIAKIEAVSKQYHKAGRAMRNMGRSMLGKKPLPGIKPNGKLARLLQAPYSNQLRCLNISLKNVNKSLASLNRLEKAAANIAKANRPSTRDSMKRYRRQIEEKDGTSTKTTVKKKTAEL